MIQQGNVEAVDKLSKSAIEIAHAVGDLGALKVMFGFAVTFTALLLIVFVAQIISNQKMLRAIKETSDKTGRYFSDLSNRTVGKEEAKAITKETLDRSCALVKYYILKIRMENHLINKESTFNRIRLMVDNDFNGQRAFLGKFLYKERQLSFIATLEDSQAISNLMTEQVYLPIDNFTVSLMSQAVAAYFDGLKLKLLEKIDEL